MLQQALESAYRVLSICFGVNIYRKKKTYEQQAWLGCDMAAELQWMGLNVLAWYGFRDDGARYGLRREVLRSC